MKHCRPTAALLSLTLAAGWDAAAAAQTAAKQPPITIEINSSPWYGGFETVVDRYEKQTGNKVTLDVTPFNGMREKARDAVRDKESPCDLVNLTTLTTVEFYEGGFLRPLTEIDPSRGPRSASCILTAPPAMKCPIGLSSVRQPVMTAFSATRTRSITATSIAITSATSW
jgi:ABC-type glycerol-3-phosphate transport system substrate-binding protein